MTAEQAERVKAALRSFAETPGVEVRQGATATGAVVDSAHHPMPDLSVTCYPSGVHVHGIVRVDGPGRAILRAVLDALEGTDR